MYRVIVAGVRSPADRPALPSGGPARRSRGDAMASWTIAGSHRLTSIGPDDQLLGAADGLVRSA